MNCQWRGLLPVECCLNLDQGQPGFPGNPFWPEFLAKNAAWRTVSNTENIFKFVYGIKYLRGETFCALWARVAAGQPLPDCARKKALRPWCLAITGRYSRDVLYETFFMRSVGHHAAQN